jgi:hypothetical protein
MMPVHSEPRPACVASVPFFEIVECRGFSHCPYDVVAAFKRKFCQNAPEAVLVPVISQFCGI